MHGVQVEAKKFTTVGVPSQAGERHLLIVEGQ